jgi:CheY-like chemotaxis protein
MHLLVEPRVEGAIILLVEDDPVDVACHAMQFEIAPPQATVLHCQSTITALAWLRDHAATAHGVVSVLVSWSMDGARELITACRELRSALDLRIIALADAAGADKDALAAGADRAFLKQQWFERFTVLAENLTVPEPPLAKSALAPQPL